MTIVQSDLSLFVKLTIAIFLFLLHFLTYGQIITHAYTADDGLAQGFVPAVTQGRDGFIWAGTNNGLSRFDGTGFKNFRTNTPGRQPIFSNQVQKLLKDQQGRLWVVNGGRIQLFNEQNNTFFTPEYFTAHPETLFSRTFTDRNGNFWILADDKILGLQITETKGGPDLKGIAQISIDANLIRKPEVLLSLDSVLWLGAGNGLFEFQPKTGRWSAVWQKKDGKVTQLWADTNFGGVWMVANGGAALIHGRQLRWFPEVNSSLAVRTSGTFFDHKTWLVDTRNVFEWDGKTLTPKLSNLPFQIVSACTDDQGYLWLGSNAKGLFQVNLKENNISTLWPDDMVTEPVYKDGGGHIFSLKEKGCRSLSAVGMLPAWFDAGQKMKSLAVDALGRAWYFDCNNILSGPEAGFRSALQSLSANISVNKMRCMPDGSIVVVKPRSVLIVNPATGKELSLVADTITGINLKNGFEINSIKTGANGAVWLGLNDGVVRLVPVWQSGNITFQFFPTTGMLTSPAVLSLELGDTSGATVFLGTLSGFYRWQPASGDCEKILTRDITPDEVVYCMQKDLRGNIWLGTNAGLKMYNPAEKTSKCLTSADGLPASEFNRNTESISLDGEILMGTVKGAVRFYPDVLSRFQRTLRLAFTDISLNDSLISIPGVDEEICVKPSDDLVISFMLLDFGPAASHKFRYKLSGVSEDWEISNKPSVTYKHLSPGSYIFEVSGSNGLSGWSDSCVIKIYVERPLWQKLGMLLLLLTSGAGVLFFWYRQKNSRKEIAAAVPESAVINGTEEPEPAPVYLVHEKVLALVEMHFRESEFNVLDIQEKLRISKVHLHRKMIEETGKTAAYFLKKRRMDEAIKLLTENPEMTVAQVAYASGFSDPNYFSTVFTSNFGKSPRKFREKL